MPLEAQCPLMANSGLFCLSPPHGPASRQTMMWGRMIDIEKFYYRDPSKRLASISVNLRIGRFGIMLVQLEGWEMPQ